MTPQSPVPRGAFIINMYFMALLLFMTACRVRFHATAAERPNWRLYE